MSDIAAPITADSARQIRALALIHDARCYAEKSRALLMEAEALLDDLDASRALVDGVYSAHRSMTDPVREIDGILNTLNPDDPIITQLRDRFSCLDRRATDHIGRGQG